MTALKKMKVYEWHKLICKDHAYVNDDFCVVTVNTNKLLKH
jgi:hypothetical protein